MAEPGLHRLTVTRKGSWRLARVASVVVLRSLDSELAGGTPTVVVDALIRRASCRGMEVEQCPVAHLNRFSPH